MSLSRRQLLQGAGATAALSVTGQLAGASPPWPPSPGPGPTSASRPTSSISARSG
ncbi:twin-arginine translocation signal domain-containing protein [Nonomuraea thailandensis]